MYSFPEEEHHLGDPPRIIEMKPDASTSHDTSNISNAASYDRSIHGEDAIVVEMPNDPNPTPVLAWVQHRVQIDSFQVYSSTLVNYLLL
jgi:hypothetical protein